MAVGHGGGGRYVAVAVALMLLAALPFTPLVRFKPSEHIDPTTAEPDAHLPTQDYDKDGMPDWWELKFGLDPFNASDALIDTDGDGYDLNHDGQLTGGELFTNLMEWEQSTILGNYTIPTDPDTDGDGMDDGWEVWYGLNPLAEEDAWIDGDEDGYDADRDEKLTPTERYTNLDEFLNDTHPWDPDTDGDEMPDGWEVHYGLDPRDYNDAHHDTDDDGWDANFDGEMTYADHYTNREEYFNDTNPIEPDTDGDWIIDSWEVRFGLDPLDGSDNDDDLENDGLINSNEFNNTWVPTSWLDVDGILSTRPDLNDTDGDNLSDNDELFIWLTDPTHTDTDGDGMPDGWEARYGLDPRNPADAHEDADNDGHDYDRSLNITSDEWCTNLAEYHNGTDPTDPDSDGDTMYDGWEMRYGLDPLNASDADDDPDADGWDFDRDGMVSADEQFTNIQEYHNDTRPDRNDTDYDHIWDGWEVHFLLNPLDIGDAAFDLDSDGFDADWNGTLEIPERHTNLDEFRADTHPRDPDTDGDGMPDGWEVLYGLQPVNASDADDDTDADGLVNRLEYNNTAAGSGYLEVDGRTGTQPQLNDTDDDGLSDGAELLVWLTDPSWNDTDFDGMPDGWEVGYGLDPTNASDADYDTDRDGFDVNWNGTLEPGENFTNLMEYLAGTDPTRADSDGDDMWDGWEVFYGLQPTNASDAWDDADNDTLVNLHEFNNSLVPGFDDNVYQPVDHITGSNPLWRDTDNDLIPDGEETIEGEDGYVTDPSNPDSDSDGMPDGWEIMYDLNPFDPADADEDADADGYDFDNSGAIDPDERFTNLQEYLNGTDPTNPDTDNDTIGDGWEAHYGYLINYTLISPLDPGDAAWDADSDGYDADRDSELSPEEKYTNREEYLNGTNPIEEDTDGDNCTDGWEVYWDEHKPANETRTLDPLNATDGGEDYDDDGWEDWEGTWHDFPNRREEEAQTDPWDPDTDDDGMSDGYEADN